MYCKHCGKEIANESKFCSFCGKSLETSLPPNVALPKAETANHYIPPDNKALTVGMIMTAVLYFISAVLWFFIGTIQTTASAFNSTQDTGLLGMWNILISFLFIAIGIGILQRKNWGYDWGLWTAVLNVFFLGYQYLQNSSTLILFLCLISIAMVILLLSNKDNFIKATIQTASADDTTEEGFEETKAEITEDSNLGHWWFIYKDPNTETRKKFAYIDKQSAESSLAQLESGGNYSKIGLLKIYGRKKD